MSRSTSNKNGLPAAGNPLRTLSPKTVVAIVLMVLMGILWLRVLTGGNTGLSTVQAAKLTDDVATARSTAPVRIMPNVLPLIEGRHDTLRRDFFSQDNWPGFNQPDNTPAAPTGFSDLERQLQRKKAAFEDLAKTLNLDAILRATGDGPARVCIDGKVLMQGQSLTVKTNTENYELTVSEIGENQVVLTWNNWNVVLKMTQPERID